MRTPDTTENTHSNHCPPGRADQPISPTEPKHNRNTRVANSSKKKENSAPRTKPNEPRYVSVPNQYIFLRKKSDRGYHSQPRKSPNSQNSYLSSEIIDIIPNINPAPAILTSFTL
jgi:hypothetical protein